MLDLKGKAKWEAWNKLKGMEEPVKSFSIISASDERYMSSCAGKDKTTAQQEYIM